MASDADTAYLEGLLAASLDRAAEVNAYHTRAVAEQRTAADALTSELDRGVAELADQERRLTEAEARFATLRQAEVDKGRAEAAAIRAVAEQEAEAVAAQISAMQQACAENEQQHRTRIADLEAKRIAEDRLRWKRDRGHCLDRRARAGLCRRLRSPTRGPRPA